MYAITYPKSTITQRHIVNYDRLQKFDSETPLRYFAFPQKGVTLFILKNAVVTSLGNAITISKSTKETLTVVLLGKYRSPLLMTYLDFVEEVAINFNETGIHYFFSNHWSGSELLTTFEGHSLGLDAEQLFSGDADESQVYLEDYLINRYSDKDISAVEKAIFLINRDPGDSLPAIAQQVFLSEKTLNRQFQKYVGCTISTYKSITRFRNTISTYFENNTLSLTELCLENNYFDSPHFYKQMKKIAHFNPKDFFNKVKANGLGAYPYIFE